MTRKRLFAVAAAIILGACAPEASYWSEAQSPKANRVEAVRLWHDLSVPASGRLSDGERAGLDAFLARHEIGYGDDVTVLAAGGRDPAPLADYLRKEGIVAHTVSGGAAPAGGLRLLVERYVVTPPNCPDWRKPGSEDYGNAPMSNLGCATAVNFGLMVADPRELIQGRRPGDADGTASAAATQRYRADKVKALPNSSTTQ
jgi:pilus assembly protein CpaD